MTTPDGTPPVPAPPQWYTAPMRTVWEQEAAEIIDLGHKRPLNPDRLNALVGHIMRARRASELMATSDVLINRDGVPVDNPLRQIISDEEQAAQKIRREFGLTRRPLPPDTTRPDTALMPPTAITPLGRWCDVHQRRECESRRANGEQCHGSCVATFARCRKHLGMSLSDPRVVLAKAEAKNPLAGQPKDIGPAQALLWRVRVYAGEVERLDQRIASMSEDELMYGTTRTELKEDYGDVPERVTVREERLSPWLVLRAQREKALQDACTAAIRADVSEKLVEMVKMEAALLARLIISALGKLGITDDEQVKTVVRGAVAELQEAS